MNHHSFSCQGESHKYSEKPCQDSSFSYSGNGISIAIVCDGHGGERYYRSDIGSKICIQVTEKAIRTFVDSVDKTLFKDKPFTQKKCFNELNSFELNCLNVKSIKKSSESLIFTKLNTCEYS